MNGGDLAEATVSRMRFGQFLSVGIVGAICDVLVLAVVVETTHVEPFYAKFLSAETAILVMFVINERWTFAEFGTSSVRDVTRRLLTSNIVRAGGAAVALVVLFVLTEFFDVWYLAANVAGIGVGFVLNYTAESLVTWRVHWSNDNGDS